MSAKKKSENKIEDNSLSLKMEDEKTPEKEPQKSNKTTIKVISRARNKLSLPVAVKGEKNTSVVIQILPGKVAEIENPSMDKINAHVKKGLIKIVR